MNLKHNTIRLKHPDPRVQVKVHYKMTKIECLKILKRTTEKKSFQFVLIKWTTVKHTLLPFVLSIGHGLRKTV